MSTFASDAIRAEISDGHAVGRYWKELIAGEFGNTGLPISASTSALSNQLTVKSGQGMLFGISGFNNNAAAQFIQIHDVQGVPADGAIPVVVITVPTVANFSMDWIFPGRYFRRGIYICNSSTAATKTIGSADCWIDAQFI